MRILVVDDDDDMRDVLSCCLRYLGRCDTAENGLVAAEKFKQAYLEGFPYMLVTMDCQMPVLGGFGAISMIRTFETAQRGEWFRTTICIISADDNCLERYEQQHGLDSCLYYIRKPFLVDDIRGIAQLALGRTRAALTHLRPAPQTPSVLRQAAGQSCQSGVSHREKA